MPIIEVWGIADPDQERLENLLGALVDATLSIKELGLVHEGQVTVQFLGDMLAQGLGEEIIVKVYGLFDKPGRTNEVRQRLARDLTVAVHHHYPEPRIETLIHEFNPNRGYFRFDPVESQPNPSGHTVAIGGKGIAAVTGDDDDDIEDGGILRI